MSAGERFEKMLALMARLRSPEGCPWDRKQTLDSLRPYIVEEAYELVEAISTGDADAVREELGDVTLEVVFVAEIARELGLFTIEQVLDGLHDKLVRRHPHVFAAESAGDHREALSRWEDVKAAEKAHPSALHAVPLALPALSRALKLSSRAARVGFDWPSVSEILEKLDEELSELEAARESGDARAVSEEVGDILFVVANLARRLGVDPELALQDANRKFTDRFEHVEYRLKAEGRSPSESSLAEMEALWQEAKRRG